MSIYREPFFDIKWEHTNYVKTPISGIGSFSCFKKSTHFMRTYTIREGKVR